MISRIKELNFKFNPVRMALKVLVYYRVFFIDCDTEFDYKTFKNYFLMLVLVLK